MQPRPDRLWRRGLVLLLIGLAGLALLASRPALALDYRVAVAGLDDHAELRQLVHDAALLEQLRASGVPSLFVLRQRAADDVERVQAVLRARGYYDGTVETDAAMDDGGSEAVATIRVETGPLYRIGSIAIEGAEGQPLSLMAASAVKLKTGAPARSSDILAAETDGLSALRAAGYAKARVARRRLLVNHDRHSMAVHLRFAPGPLVRLGAVQVEGLGDVAPVAVMRRIDWQPGALYSPSRLGATRGSIAALEVFESVDVSLVGLDAVSDQADEVTLPVRVVVKERPFRTIGGAATLSTDAGGAVEARWTHRNILGKAEKLEVVAHVGRLAARDARGIDTSLGATLTKPDFLRRGQVLTVESQLAMENPEAYERQALELGASLERPLFEHARGSTGVKLAVEKVKDNDDSGRERFVTVSFPNAIRHDTVDNPLDPTSGHVLSASVEPVLGVLDPGGSYLVAQLSGKTYWEALADKRLVLAGRATLGSIFGASTNDVPANQRFYAGGDGSVRGYAYQAIGPKDADGNPTGGRSLVELNTEARIRVTEDIGIVPFIDAGMVTDQSYIDFSGDLRVGAGLGLRYYTGFGPLRADLGIPINPGRGDNTFELYFSFGQAF